MTIPKEKFFEILDYIQENDKFEEGMRQLLTNSKRVTDFMDPAMFTDCRMVDYLIYLLEHEYEDLDNGWISYWIYDLHFGEYWTPNSIVDFKGRSIKLQTKEDLYTFLINNIVDDYIGGTD